MNHYRFRSTWLVAGRPDRVFDVLGDLATYPQWWPEVRSIRQIDDVTAGAVIRAFLPYSLHLVMRQVVKDRQTGELKVSLGGDLEGYSRFLIEPRDAGCVLHYRQEVVARKRLLRMLAPIARPLFSVNHLIMMKRGNRGLTRYLEEVR